jgi:Trk K+ transport system NAD-binding subunit
MFEVRIEPGSAVNGRSIRELGLPTDVLISSIVRRERIVLPKGSTSLSADDLLFVLAPKSRIDEVSRILSEPKIELDENEARELELESRR